MSYPLIDTIRTAANDKNETVEWVAAKVGKTRRWLYDQTIEHLSLEHILKISQALNFDLLADYNKWLEKNNLSAVSLISEPIEKYEQKEKKITVALTITASYNTYGLHFGELLKTLKKEGDKYGFDIE